MSRGQVKSLQTLLPENGALSRARFFELKQGINPMPPVERSVSVAKDGTYRGGRRIRAGSKPDSAAEKIKNGQTPKIISNDIPELEADELEAVDLPDGAVLEGADMPKPGEYLSARQKNGKPLGADAIYKET